MSNRWYNRTIKNNTKETQKNNFKKVNQFMNINWKTEYNNNVRKLKKLKGLIDMMKITNGFNEMGTVKEEKRPLRILQRTLQIR